MNLKNDNGFTLIEILVAVTILVILAAAGLKVYYGVFGKADVGAITNNVNQLETVTQDYVMSTGGSFAGISAANMQADGDLPPNWSVSGAMAVPPNQGIVSGYYITQGASGMTGDAFDIGFTGPQITNNEVRDVCGAFENKIIEFGYNGSAYPVATSGTNCAAIPADNVNITQPFYLGFE